MVVSHPTRGMTLLDQRAETDKAVVPGHGRGGAGRGLDGVEGG